MEPVCCSVTGKCAPTTRISWTVRSLLSAGSTRAKRIFRFARGQTHSHALSPPRIPGSSEGQAEFRSGSSEVFTRPIGEFLHYYESSGTTGDPVAAPKALDDLAANTINIGQMWRRVLTPADSALILINGPFAPAGYQFEKVMEYLGVLSLRLWVDNVTGDYTRILRLLRELSVSTYVGGSPSRLLEMLHFAYRHGEPLPRFRRLLLVAEQAGPSLRHLERLTGAKAFVGSFGSSETGTTAATCEEGRLHLQVQS
jgi:phenylacetate-CoA ligase